MTGPGAAGALIKLTGAPLALLADAMLLVISALILRALAFGVLPKNMRRFWLSMREGVRFVRSHRLLLTMAICVGVWENCNQAAMVIQILFATRQLGLSERTVGTLLCGIRLRHVTASAVGFRVVRRLGNGATLVLGFAISGSGWLLLAAAPTGPYGVAAYVFMLLCFGVGAVFIFINFLSLRQSVTPAPMLGRMTSIMRWLILVPAVPGALLGGWLGEHLGLRSALAFAGTTSLLLFLVSRRLSVIRSVTTLPTISSEAAAL